MGWASLCRAGVYQQNVRTRATGERQRVLDGNLSIL
jgi:hypothetical protein